MRPFKMFFGLSIAIMLFYFIARIAIVAFIAAGIMSIIYAVYRRLKDFVTYDSYGEPYFQSRQFAPAHLKQVQIGVEPLFNKGYSAPFGSIRHHDIQVIKIS